MLLTLFRKASHLTDQNATVYAIPTYSKDHLQNGLNQTGGPVDVSGGWFDAGDYLKFVQTASYVTAMMGIAARDYFPNSNDPLAVELLAEFKFGIQWLIKMWNNNTGELYESCNEYTKYLDIIKLVLEMELKAEVY
jgi:hypothetical protein